jgi:histidinol-phosphatase (PHP family)
MKYNLISIDKLSLFDTHRHSVDHGPEMKNFSSDMVKQLIDTCAEKGLRVLCITDHVPLPPDILDPTPDKDCGLSMQDVKDILINNRMELKDYAKQKNLILYLGGEFDFFAENKDFYEMFDNMYKPDFKVIGQHFIDTIEVAPDNNGEDCYGVKIKKKQKRNFCFDFSESAFAFGVKQIGTDNLVARYFVLLEKALTMQRYDSVAHIDLITKYNEGGKYFKEDSAYRNKMKRIINKMINKEIALEINLSATDSLNRLVPRDWIIKEAVANGIPVTLGSDIHGLGDNEILQKKTKEMLKEIGIQKIAVPEY